MIVTEAKANVVCKTIVPVDANSYSSGTIICSMSGTKYEYPPDFLHWAINATLVPKLTIAGK